ncbi:hypothetical protein BWR17_12770 [Phaeobacter inhibens]|nr:hypothetical protein BWR17_12770 [Phaeobacter inhibens]
MIVQKIMLTFGETLNTTWLTYSPMKSAGIVKQGAPATTMRSITIARKVESMKQQILTMAISGWLLILEISATPAGIAMNVE